MKLRKLINRLLDNAIMEPLVSFTRHKGKPGERIARLPPEERELLVNATSADFEAFRQDYLKMFIGPGPDQTIVIKKEMEKKFNRRKMAL